MTKLLHFKLPNTDDLRAALSQTGRMNQFVQTYTFLANNSVCTFTVRSTTAPMMTLNERPTLIVYL